MGIKRIHGLKIDCSIGEFLPPQYRKKRVSLEKRRFGDTDNITDGRKNIKMADILFDFIGIYSRNLHDERYPYRRIICKKTMTKLTMLTQRFSMISGKNNHCLIDQLFIFETL